MRLFSFEEQRGPSLKTIPARLALILFCQLLGHYAAAWETDNFTCRTRPLADVTTELNAESNRRLQLAMRNANSVTQDWIDGQIRAANGSLGRDIIWQDVRRRQTETRNSEESLATGAAQSGSATPSTDGNGSKIPIGMLPKNDPISNIPIEELRKGPSCNREILTAYLSNAIASGWVDNLETWADAAPIPKCRVDVEDSVFSVFSFRESPVAKGAGINPVINVNGYKIGIDKISHFMTEGYNYMRAKKNGGGLTAALNLGVMQEEGGFGLSTTGVKSFADLAANYKGLSFWENLFDEQRPYFRCENGAWRQVRSFDWKEFVDSSFDESINCNEYRTPEMTAKVDAEIERRWSAAGLTAKTCPASNEECYKLVGSIQPEEALKSVLHPRCLRAGGYEGSIPEAISAPVAERPSSLLELRLRGREKVPASATPVRPVEQSPVAR